jgi:adenine-specific DNA methylase
VTNSLKYPQKNVPSESEAIVNKGMGKDHDSYEKLLTLVFHEAERVLKTGGQLIFTFHHSKVHAWWTVLSSLCKSGFHIKDYFPVMSEYKVSPHIRKKKNIDMDLVLVCERRQQLNGTSTLSLAEVTELVSKSIPLNIHDQNRNKLFSYYIGELMKYASSNTDIKNINRSWFEDVMQKFDDVMC